MSASDTPSRPAREPWAYFVTFACYGARLHGSTKGSVHREWNAIGGPFLKEDSILEAAERRRMREPPVVLNARARRIVLESIIDACNFRGWTLHAAHVRSNHVHVVVDALAEPSQLLQKIKARASRALNERFRRRQRWWAVHGSTIPLWEPHRVNDAVAYVWDQQGAPMARYRNPSRWNERLRW